MSDIPNVSFRKFTPCGRFLVSVSNDGRDLVVFRLEAGGRRVHPRPESHPSNADLDFDESAYVPPPPIAEQSSAHWLSDSNGNPFAELMPTEPVSLSLPPQQRNIFLPPANNPTGLLALPVPVVNTPAPSEEMRNRHSCSFDRFFTKLYQVPIATEDEIIVREFCLATPRSRYLILASSHTRDPAASPPPTPPPAVSACPVLERFTLHLVDVETGQVADRFTLNDDYVYLHGHASVHMYGDLLLVLTIRRQTVYIIKVQEGLGRFAEEKRIGGMCMPDDELEIARARAAEHAYKRRVQRAEEDRARAYGRSSTDATAAASSLANGVQEPEREQVKETGLGNGKMPSGFYTGLMQRLLVYVYRRFHSEGNHRLFYRVVGQYSMLVMLKAQFLDEDHLLIRLGSYQRRISDVEPGLNTCFFVVYCMSSTRILNLFENRSTELLAIYEKYRDVFIGDTAVTATLPPVRPSGGADGASEGDIPRGWRRDGPRFPVTLNRNTGSSRGRPQANFRRTRSALSVLPVSCQSRNVSPYLDRSLFSYNVDRLAALDGTRALSLRDVNSVKFTSVRTGAMRFKLSPGVPVMRRRDGDGLRMSSMHRRKKTLFLFHPQLPFVLSMEYCLALSTILNFHVYGHGDRR